MKNQARAWCEHLRPDATRRACPYRKLNPDILVVQSAQNWYRQNLADGLYGAD